MSVIIRSLEKGDHAAWKSLWKAYLAFYDTVLSDETIDTNWQRLLLNDPHEFHGLLAVDESGNAIGLAHYLFHRHGWNVNNVCYLQDLFVCPKLRSQGVGKKLIQAVYMRADEQQASQVYWMTQSQNTTARKLYDKVADLTPFIKYQR